jgi:uncharacterized membrane protein YgdD (TMEM256/DUF423 family)
VDASIHFLNSSVLKNVHKPILIAAILFGLTAILLGAFGAHGLEAAELSSEKLHAWHTGVQYQFYHSFALLFAGLAAFSLNTKWVKRAALCFTLGIFFFSGSLYTMAITELAGLTLPWLGPITPIGGLFFAGGWALLLLSLNARK